MQYLVHASSIARWSVLLVFFLLPFFFIPAAWVTIGASKMLLVSFVAVIATAAWALASFNEGTLRLPRSFLFVAAALIPLAYVISALATGASYDSFVGGVEQDTVVAVSVWFALFVISANVLAIHTDRIVASLRALLLGGGILLLIQAVHLAAPSFTFGGSLVGAAASAAGSWHDLAILAALLLFFSLALREYIAANFLWHSLLVIEAIAAAALLIIIHSKDVWVSLMVLALLFALYQWRRLRPGDLEERKRGVRRVAAWVLLAAAAGGMYWGGTFVQGRLPSSLQVVNLEVRPSWKGTFAVGQQVFAKPASVFFGSGPNTFPRQWGLYKPLSVNTTQFWNTDFYAGVGFIPTAIVTVGVLGFLAWLAVLLALLSRARGIFFAEESGGGRRAVVAAGALYSAAYHVFFVPGPGLTALTFLLVGVLLAEEVSARSIRDRTFSLSWDTLKGKLASSALLLFTLLVFLGGFFSIRALISESLVNRGASIYAQTQDLGAASRSVSVAIALDPMNDRARRAAVELGILQLSRLAQSGAGESARAALQETLTETIRHGLAAVEIGSADYQNWLQLAYLYAQLAGVGVEGAEQSARSAYEEARRDNPTNPLPLLGLAQLDVLVQNDAEARSHLQGALALKPDLAAAHFLLSQIEARAGNLEAARVSAEAAVQLVPQDPLGWYNLGTVLYAEANYADAAAVFERAVGIQDNYSNAMFLLGLSYYRLGREDDALRILKVVSLLNPADAALSETIGKIERGEDLFL